MRTQLLGDDRSDSGVVPGELNRQDWSRPSVPGFRFVAPAATGVRLLLQPAADLKQQCARDLNQLASDRLIELSP